MRWFLTVWFLFFIVLSAASFNPGIVFLTFILTLGIGGLLMIAANTILLYSFAFLPALFAWRRPDAGTRLRRTLRALVIPATIAIAPNPLSTFEAELFGRTISSDDFEHQSLGKPKTIEIVTDTWDPGRPLCNNVCLRLLFNHEVDSVRIVNLPVPHINYYGGYVEVVGEPHGLTFSIARRVSCPEAILPRDSADQAVRDRLATGECLISTGDDQGQADVRLALTTLYAGYFMSYNPQASLKLEVSPPWPLRTYDARIQRLTIAQRGDDGTNQPIMQRTESKLETLALPFYFGHNVGIPPNVVNVGPKLGRQQFVINSIDFNQILKTKFGFQLDPVSALQPAAAASMVEQILSLPTTDLFTTQQSSVINEALTKLVQQADLADADIALIRRVIADARVNDGLIGFTEQNLFRKFAEQLEPSIPLVLDRLAIPVRENVGHYHSLLGWALMAYQADTLAPFRAQIFQIVEQQPPEWPNNGLLVHVAELDGDPTDLIAQRLSAKSWEVRAAAATAACRAAPAVWALIEPMLLDHLGQPITAGRPRSEDSKLLLALIRFGNTEAVATYVSRLNEDERSKIQRMLSDFHSGFAIERCQILT
jgi:hypothetical protein